MPRARTSAAPPKTKRTQKPPSDSVPSATTPSVQSVDQALTQTRAAIEALRAAANDSPARYTIALKYRLDALAHHLTQVAEFVETLRV